MTTPKPVEGLSFYVTVSRSEAMWAPGGPMQYVDDTDQEITLGPFPDYIQLTYEGLRVGPDGDDIGGYKDGYWWIDGHEYPFSDVIVFVGESV